MEQFLTFSADLTASETDRTISGKIVPLGAEVGNTSVGKVIFEKNSISIPDGKTIKLLSQHDVKKPIGKMKSFEVTDDAIYATFSISKSQRGNDALILAAEGLESGLSVGVDVLASKPKQGVLYVTKASLQEVSLVTEPAFKSAQVTDIAASEEETPAEVVEETQPTESEQSVENTNTETVAAPEIEASAVEAARPTVAVTNVRERVKPLSASEYLQASIKAATGDDEARRAIYAADNDTTTNTGLTLPQHMQEFVSTTIGGRPTIDAFSTGVLPASGMSFTIPKLTTAPTVDDVVAETDPISTTQMASSYITVDVKKAASLQTISWELLDRSSPIFYDELIRELGNAYAKATDVAMLSAAISGGTAGTGTTADADGLQSYIATESAAAYGASGSFASNLIANSTWWAKIMAAQDSSKRPLYTASNPYNNPGSATGTSIRGAVLGANLYVDPFFGAGDGDDSMLLVAPDAATFYESPRRTLQVQVLGTGELQVAIYGYYGIAIKKPTGIRRFNKS